MIQRKLDRSWVLTWFLTLVVITALASVSLFYDPSKVKADPVIFENTDTAFRIVEVRAEQGYLVVEVQHFKPDGSHWFYDLYSWQGREEFNKSNVLNLNGEKLLEDGSVAPYIVNKEVIKDQYIHHDTIYFQPTLPSTELDEFGVARPPLPTDLVVGGDFEVGATKQDVINALGEPDFRTKDTFSYRVGADWKYHEYPKLNSNRILFTILGVHLKRSASGWTRGLGRVVLPKMNGIKTDFDGVNTLVARFKVLEGTVYNYDGSLYEGDGSELAKVEEYFERVDLRTEESKTYQLGPENFKTENSSALHYKDENGDWKNTSLNFIEHVDIDGTPLWVMKTHPRYHAIGELNSISMVSPTGKLGGRWYTPGPLTYEGQTAWYEHEGLKWTYTLNRAGIKLESEPIEARGERDYSFVFLPLGDLGPLTIDNNGNAVTGGIEAGEFLDESIFFYYDEGDIAFLEPQLVVPRAYIVGADGEKYPGGAWEIVDDYTIKFNFDDSILPDEAFPYVIDPSMSFSDDLGTTAADGFIIRTSNSWPPSGTVSQYTSPETYMYIKREKVSSNYTIAMAKMQWDTSDLPDDAYITSAYVRLYFLDGLSTHANQDHCIAAIWQSGSAASHPSSVGTYVWQSEGYDNAINCLDLTDLYNNGGNTGYRDLPLENFGYLGIDTRGTTGLQMTFKNDHDPYGYWYVGLRSYVEMATHENTTYDAPKLVVTYSLPGVLACNSTKARFYPNQGSGGDPGIDASIAINASGYADLPATMEDAAGYDAVYVTAVDMYSGFYPGTSTQRYTDTWIPVLGFDTSSLPNDAIILRGTISMVRTRGTSTWWNDNGLEEVTFGFVEFSPASDNSYTALDWLELGPNLLTREKRYQDISDDEFIRHQFDLNSAGKDYINLTGVTHVAYMDEFSRGHSQPWSLSVTLAQNSRSIFSSWISSDGAHQFGMGGAMTPGVYLGLETGNQAPLLEVEYITPCSFIDGDLSTVSDTVTVSFSPYRKGYVQCDPSGTVAWIKIHQAVAADGSCGGGVGTAEVTIVNNNPTMDPPTALGTAGTIWDWQNRAVLVYDTSSLPNYRSSCTVNQTTTFITNLGNDADSGDGYIQILTSAKNFGGLKNNYFGGNTYDDTSTSAWSGVLAGSATDTWIQQQRGYFIVDNTSIPATAIITGANLYIYGKTIDADYPNDGMVLMDYDPSGETALGGIWDIAMSDSIRLSDPIRMDKLTTSGYNTFRFNTAGVRMIQQSITPAYDHMWHNQIPMFITNLSDTGTHEILQTDWNVSPARNTGQPGWTSGGGTRLEWWTVDEAGTSKDPYLEVYYDMPCPGIIEAEIWIYPSDQSIAKYNDPSNVDTFEFGHVVLASPSSLNDATAYGTMGAVSYGFVPLEHARITSSASDPIIIKLNNIGKTAIDDGSGTGYLGVSPDGYTEFAGRVGSDMHYREELAADAFADTAIGFKIRETGIKFGGSDPTLHITHGDVDNALIDASAINAGGKVLVLKVYATEWVASGGTFDAQRQNIIDGLVGSLGAGSDNWDEAVSNAMVVGDVVRTDDTTVTITFTGPYTYAPGSTETITATIPASAIETSQDVVVSPIFMIDKIPFDFASFTPTMASNSGTLQITVLGNGLPEHVFSGSEDVRLIKSGESDIVCSSVSSVGSPPTQTIVDCIVNGVATGLWDVKVTNSIPMDDTKLAALTLYQNWSSTVNGGGFSDSGSDYGIFAHDSTPFFTIQGFEEIEKEWLTSSSPPATIPLAAGKDAQFVSSYVGKDRFIVGTASHATNILWAYEFIPSTGAIASTTPSNPAINTMDVNDLDIGWYDNAVAVATDGGDFIYLYGIDPTGALSGFWNSVASAPSSPPGAECSTVDFDSNANYLAIGCTTSPYLHVYAISNGGSGTPAWSTKSTAPSTPPVSSVTGVKFSPDDLRLAVTVDNGNVLVYDFNAGSIGAVTSQNISATSGYPTSVAWLKEDITGSTVLAVGATTTPYVHAWNYDTSVTVGVGCLCFVSKLSDPTTSLTSQVTSIDFHPNDDTIVVGQISAPYVTAYNFQGVSDDDYRIYRYILNFDTSYLPDDAVVSSVVLQIKGNSINHGGCPGVGADCWDMLAYDAKGLTTLPLNIVDYDYLIYGTSDVGSISSSGIAATIAATSYFSMTISPSVVKADGATQILLRHEDDVAGVDSGSVETVDLEVGWDGTTATFPSDCVAAEPIAIHYDSQYNTCNSINQPFLQITYTSVSTGAPPDLTTSFTNTETASTDGTYSIDIFAKGPVVVMSVTGSGTPIYNSSFNRAMADTTDPWSFVSATTPNKPFPFVRSIELYGDSEPHIKGTKTLWYELEGPPSSQMIDRTGTISSDTESSIYFSFPLASTSLDSSIAALISLSPTVGAEPGSPDIAADTNTASMSAMMGTSTQDNTSFFMEEWFDYVESNTGMPSGVSRLAFALVLTILLGVIAFKSFQSVAASYIVMLIAIVGFTLSFGGIFEWWMLLTFGMTAGVFIFARRAYV